METVLRVFQVFVAVALIGVGPGRDQVIWTDEGRETIAGSGDSPAWERV